jgi:hypothetical protein
MLLEFHFCLGSHSTSPSSFDFFHHEYFIVIKNLLCIDEENFLLADENSNLTHKLDFTLKVHPTRVKEKNLIYGILKRQQTSSHNLHKCIIAELVEYRFAYA